MKFTVRDKEPSLQFFLEERKDTNEVVLAVIDHHGNDWSVASVGKDGLYLFGGIPAGDLPVGKDGKIKLRVGD